LAEPEISPAPRGSSAAARRAWTIAVGGTVLALSLAIAVLPQAIEPFNPLAVLAVGALFLVSESIEMHVEFRRQTYSWSLAELALTIALVEVGGFWATLAWIVALALQTGLRGHFQPAKALFNLSMALLHGSVAVAVLQALPDADITEPLGWLNLVLAVLVANIVVALMISVAIIGTAGYPGPSLWREQLVPIAVVSPVIVSVGIIALLLSTLSPWAWLLILPVLTVVGLLFRRFGKVAREGSSVERVYDFARRVEQVSPDEAGTQQIVLAVRELLNAERVALWLPPYLDEEPRLIVSAENGAVWYDGPGDPDDLFRRRAVVADGPLLVSLSKADEEEAAALARRGVSDLLGAPVMTAAGEPGYLEVCDRRSEVMDFAESDRAALDSMLTHVNAAIRHQQLLTQIRYDADHDRLTGLPNRQRLAAEIEQLLSAEPMTARAGLILASLGNYTEVTDTLGHAASDELLLVTAGLLREHAPPHALLARMEGEQFAVLLPGLSLQATERAARRLREAASTRARVAGLDLEVTLTIGVAAAPVHGTDAGTLMQRADVALLAAADSGGVASYHPVLDQQSLRRLQLGTELETAMHEGQITVVYQPIIDAQTSDIVSVETLVRWAHPRYGSIPPDDFIHLAEQIGRIGPLTDHVLDLALARCRRWLDQDIALSVAVNLSVHCLTDPELVSRVRRALQRHRVPGELLTLELTEGSVVDDSVRDSSVLADLHGLGLRLSMDDFGTGYSSLSQLRQLPIDEVKIDKSFVLGMSTSQGESFIARSIIELAHNLGLRVVAEGVEDELTRNLLADMGCDKLQGFLVSRPLPDDRLESWLLARTGVRSAAPGATHRRLFVRT
jgi:diguanylate cyclase (GGDEF)-like protein